jgi:hypothetical protein
MALRILIRCRSDHVPGPESKRTFFIAEMACKQALGRSFTWDLDYMRSQDSILQSDQRCYVLIDCGVEESGPDLEKVPLCYFRAKWDCNELYLPILELRAFR